MGQAGIPEIPPLPFLSQTRPRLTLTAASSCPLLMTPPCHGVLDVPPNPSPPHSPWGGGTGGQVPPLPLAQRMHQLSEQLHVYLGVSRGVSRLLYPDITV